MKTYDTFFIDLLAAEGPFIEPHQAEPISPDHELFVRPKNKRRMPRFAAIGVLVAAVAVSQNSSGATSSERQQPTTQTTSTNEASMIEYDTKAAQEDVAKRMYTGFLYDHYHNQAKDFANRDMVAACRAAVDELAKISIGPVIFDCDLSDNG